MAIGALEIPSAGDVRAGVGFGASGVEYTGTMVVPSVDDVQESVPYGSGGIEYTGVLGLPDVSEVKLLVGYGANDTEYTGTLESTDPGISNVIKDTAYVIESDAKTGTFDEAARNVGVTGDKILTGNSITIQSINTAGTFDEAARNTDPGETNVVLGTTYKILSDDKTGNVTLPSVGNVRLSVTYGALGTEYTGTLDVDAQEVMEAQVILLRSQVVELSNDLSGRAQRTDINSINVEVSAEQIVLDTKLEDLEGCQREILGELIDTRTELSEHEH